MQSRINIQKSRCDGLPVALEAVFKALKDKSVQEWKEALQRWEDTLQRLQTFTPGIPIDMELSIYSCIELSYNQLKRREDKDFFLQCAQMAYPNSQMDLLRNCYGLGLFSGINSLEGARNTVCRLLRCLKDSGLLQDCSAMRGCRQSYEHFHMHDVVRDVARSIASTDHNIIAVRDGGSQREWPAEYVLKGYKALSIDAKDIHKIPNKMEFPELKLFFMTGIGDSLPVLDTLFQGMGQLRVIEFKSVLLLSVPPSVTFLTNLRTLKLDDCELEDITIIGKLKNLAILSLRDNNIQQLPEEIGLLIHLRLLDLSYNFNLEVIPPNVLPNLVELEELYMIGTNIKWKVERVNNERNSASLIELNHLSQLVTLEIHIRDASYLPNDLLLLPMLERYKISVKDHLYKDKLDQKTRLLFLVNVSSFQLETTFRNLLKRMEVLLLYNFEGVNYVPHKLDREDLQHLKHLKIKDNHGFKHIIDSRMSYIIFPSLETLHLQNMTYLEEISHGQLSSKCFDKLKAIEIYDCERLKYFISLSITSGLSQLEKLKIGECSNLTTIFVKEDGKIEERQTTSFPKLRYLTLENLPKLKSFLSLLNSLATDVGEIISEGKLDCYMQILHGEVVFPMLKELDLYTIGFKDIQHKQCRAKSSCRLTNMPTTSSFQNLSNFSVDGLGNIKHLLPFFTAKLVAQLESLSIRRCKILQEIMGGEEEVVLFPRLKKLSLKNLPALKRFYMGSNINFPSLEKLEIDNCPRMKTFICKPIYLDMTASSNLKEIYTGDGSHTVMEPLFNKVVAFPSLKKLKIHNMVELKIIWESQFAIDSCCKLQHIYIEDCENLTSIFQSNMLARFQNLKALSVRNCGSLEQVFELQGLNVEERHVKIAIQLEKLFLFNLPKLRHVWDMDPYPFFSFQNLHVVGANTCESLKSLFPASMARHFTQLESLVIDKCGVEEIVSGDEAAHAMDRLIFPQVQFLHLLELPKSKQFQPRVHTSEWPKLKEILVEGCPFACAPKSNEGTLEECQHDICDKLHFLFGKNQEVEGLVVGCKIWRKRKKNETSDSEDSEEEEDSESS